MAVGNVRGVPVQGAFFLRATTDDSATFAGGITEAEFETAFPTATAQYSDNADGQEFTGAPTGSYINANGDTVSVYTEKTVTIGLTGLTETEETTIIALQNTQVDVAIKDSCGGENDLGNGKVYRDYNLHIGSTEIIGGIKTLPLTLTKKYDSKCEFTVNQTFNIAAV